MGYKKSLAAIALGVSLASCTSPKINNHNIVVGLERFSEGNVTRILKRQEIDFGEWTGLKMHCVSSYDLSEYYNFVEPTNSFVVSRLGRLKEKFPQFDEWATTAKAGVIFEDLRKDFSYKLNPYDVIEEKDIIAGMQNLGNDLKRKLLFNNIGTQTIEETVNFKVGSCEDLSSLLASFYMAADIPCWLMYGTTTNGRGHLLVMFRDNIGNKEKYTLVDPTIFKQSNYTDTLIASKLYAEKMKPFYPIKNPHKQGSERYPANWKESLFN
jgi:hypothetical protein